MNNILASLAILKSLEINGINLRLIIDLVNCVKSTKRRGGFLPLPLQDGMIQSIKRCENSSHMPFGPKRLRRWTPLLKV